MATPPPMPCWPAHSFFNGAVQRIMRGCLDGPPAREPLTIFLAAEEVARGSMYDNDWLKFRHACRGNQEMASELLLVLTRYHHLPDFSLSLGEAFVRDYGHLLDRENPNYRAVWDILRDRAGQTWIPPKWAQFIPGRADQTAALRSLWRDERRRRERILARWWPWIRVWQREETA